MKTRIVIFPTRFLGAAFVVGVGIYRFLKGCSGCCAAGCKKWQQGPGNKRGGPGQVHGPRGLSLHAQIRSSIRDSRRLIVTAVGENGFHRDVTGRPSFNATLAAYRHRQ